MASLDLAGAAPDIDRDYSGRAGYEAAFLGGGVEVPLPRADGRRLTPGALSVTLKYHQFSIRLHRRRKLAAFAAINIDGALRTVHADRSDGVWEIDPRAPDDQCRQPAYRMPFVRAPLVAASDVGWGGERRAVLGAADTVHSSNCVPLHAQLYRNWWSGLEERVLEVAPVLDARLSVFAGPVLHPRDPLLREVQVPLAYWKVVAWRERGYGLRSLGLLLRQDAPLRDAIDASAQIPGVRLDPELPDQPERARGYHAAVGRIARMTGLHFGELATEAVDGYAHQQPSLIAKQLAPGLRALRSLKDLAVS
jgi:endonuclease G, mitochondrial